MLNPALFLTMALLFDGNAPHETKPVFAEVGSATYKFGPFKLYKATLKNAGGQFTADERFDLTLRYYRNIPAAKIANASIIEMARLNDSPREAYEYLRPSLVTCFKDVEKNDEITGKKLSANETIFLINGQKSCEINEPSFSEDFFDIWLNPNGRYPKKTAQLTGQVTN